VGAPHVGRGAFDFILPVLHSLHPFLGDTRFLRLSPTYDEFLLKTPYLRSPHPSRALWDACGDSFRSRASAIPSPKRQRIIPRGSGSRPYIRPVWMVVARFCLARDSVMEVGNVWNDPSDYLIHRSTRRRDED
jgi:hypothetical protein